MLLRIFTDLRYNHQTPIFQINGKPGDTLLPEDTTFAHTPQRWVEGPAERNGGASLLASTSDVLYSAFSRVTTDTIPPTVQMPHISAYQKSINICAFRFKLFPGN